MGSGSALTRIEGLLKEVSESLKSASDAKHRADSNKVLRAVAGELDGAVKALKENHKGSLVALRKQLAILCNAVSGICDGLDEGDLSRKEMKDAISKVQSSFFVDALSSLRGEVEAAEEKASSNSSADLSNDQRKAVSKLSLSGDWQDALKTIKRELAKPAPVIVKSAPAQADTSDALTGEIEALKACEAELPSRVASAYTIVRMPVVPLFSSVSLTGSKLANIGFDVLSVEGYSIIKGQLLLAVTKKEADSHGLTLNEFAEAAISVLNEKGSVAYDIVTEQYITNPRNKAIVFFWVMPKSKLAVLTRAAGPSLGKIKWGLPV